jgi:hypothetical protein
MQPIYLEMKQGRSQKKFRKWRSGGLLKAHFVMTGVLEVTAWYSCFGKVLLMKVIKYP